MSTILDPGAGFGHYLISARCFVDHGDVRPGQRRVARKLVIDAPALQTRSTDRGPGGHL